ncbi:MAG: hypothetical protein QMD36_04470 [Candidatus Aenigmarchaeota archaeon]|nr:hypothetical protein [Candidatus Aenigmarchaeota archaeon]
MITVDGRTGNVYEGVIKTEVKRWDPTQYKTRTKLFVNLEDPETAVEVYKIFDGIGLMRTEFVILEAKYHPEFLQHFDLFKQRYEEAIKAGKKTFEFFLEPNVPVEEAKELIEEIEKDTAGYENKLHFIRDKLAQIYIKTAEAFWPKPVTIRLSDFKSDEYRGMKGGKYVEKIEKYPMAGFRGVRRYVSERYREAFKQTELAAMRMAIKEKGMTNIIMLVPEIRSIPKEVVPLKEMVSEVFEDPSFADKLLFMFEVPANALICRDFTEQTKIGWSIGSNDLTKGVLDIDRDNEDLKDLWNEADPAVLAAVKRVIDTSHSMDPVRTVSICGEGPSNNDLFFEKLIEYGIDSISVNIDVGGERRKRLWEIEREIDEGKRPGAVLPPAFRK